MKVTIQKIKLWFRGLKRLWTLASIEDRLDYFVCQELFHYELDGVKDRIKGLDVAGRYHGLLHGEGNLDGMLKIQENIKALEKEINKLKNKHLDDLSELLAFDNKLEKRIDELKEANNG